MKTIALMTALALLACQGSVEPGRSDTIRYNPPNTEFAARLNLAGPVNRDQAMAIAAEATGGSALSVAEETEDGELLFEVKVDTPSGRKEVEVRAADGGVVEIEPDDDD